MKSPYPEKMRMELMIEEGNISIKEMEVNMKISQPEGNLFTDNISGVFAPHIKKIKYHIEYQKYSCPP
jgi:hypothetical protein